jgi:hypothetical protein
VDALRHAGSVKATKVLDQHTAVIRRWAGPSAWEPTSHGPTIATATNWSRHTNWSRQLLSCAVLMARGDVFGIPSIPAPVVLVVAALALTAGARHGAADHAFAARPWGARTLTLEYGRAALLTAGRSRAAALPSMPLATVPSLAAWTTSAALGWFTAGASTPTAVGAGGFQLLLALMVPHALALLWPDRTPHRTRMAPLDGRTASFGTPRLKGDAT